MLKFINHNLRPFLFALTIFWGATLLFWVQPLMGKYLLPWFGGTPAVWSACMLFFQVFLLLGYTYSFGLDRLTLTIQTRVHQGLLLVVVFMFFALSFTWGWPLLMPAPVGLNNPMHPVGLLLGILFFSVGLPFFLLSTTSSTLQSWYARTIRTSSPYRLYVLSNTGSLLALVSYPFLVEPWLPIRHQALFWGVGFTLYAFLYWGCAAVTRHSRLVVSLPNQSIEPSVGLDVPQIFYWLYLPFLTTLLLFATTTQLTQGIASFPLLWLAPLTLYLVSYIWAFSGRNPTWLWWWGGVAVSAILASVWVLFNSLTIGAPIQIMVYLFLMLVLGIFFHSHLYGARPKPQHLTTYYLMISLGGALAGIFAVWIFPLIFSGYWEFPLVLILAMVTVVLIVRKPVIAKTGSKRAWLVDGITVLLLVYVLFMLGLDILVSVKNSVFRTRNFYGVLNVERIEPPVSTARMYRLIHGHIIHGLQFARDVDRHKPTTYYTEQSGVGMIFSSPTFRRQCGGQLNVGAIGLGVGTIAAYLKPEDRLTVYEINPAVISLTKEPYFSFIKDSPGAVRLKAGDGRLLLKQDPSRFDLLVLDAFSDDAIPVHLLTMEAFAIYKRHLSPDHGILAIHITNKHLALNGVISSLARANGLVIKIIESKGDYRYSFNAKWALLARKQTLLDFDPLREVPFVNPRPDGALWRDDYSNILSVIKLKN